jgi:hypothetical protein
MDGSNSRDFSNTEGRTPAALGTPTAEGRPATAETLKVARKETIGWKPKAAN